MCPPELNPEDYLQKRIEWRYRYGVVGNRLGAKIILGSAEDELFRYRSKKFDLLFTSPPYLGVTKYRQDSWIRLWLLNEGPALPDWKADFQRSGRSAYESMLVSAFAASAKLLKSKGVVWVRTDARKTTKAITEGVLRMQWPKRKLYMRADSPVGLTQTAHFGDDSPKPGEVDFLIPGCRKPPAGFVLCS